MYNAGVYIIGGCDDKDANISDGSSTVRIGRAV